MYDVASDSPVSVNVVTPAATVPAAAQVEPLLALRSTRKPASLGASVQDRATDVLDCGAAQLIAGA